MLGRLQQRRREHELVEREHERDQCDDGQHRRRERQHDAPEDLGRRRAVHARGLVELGGDRVEEALHQPGLHAHRAAEVDDHERGELVQPELRELQIGRAAQIEAYRRHRLGGLDGGLQPVGRLPFRLGHLYGPERGVVARAELARHALHRSRIQHGATLKLQPGVGKLPNLGNFGSVGEELH